MNRLLGPTLVAGLTLVFALAFVGCDHPTPEGESFVSVVVLSPTGNSVHVGEVTLTGPEDATASIIAGEATFTVPVGTYTVTVMAPGYDPRSQEAEVVEGGVAGNPVFIEVSLTGPAIVVGQVLNSQTGGGIGDATLQFQREVGGTLHTELEVETDADGVFRIEHAPTGTFDVVITAPGFLRATVEDVVIGNGTFTLDPVALAEVPPVGSFRVVLNWGDSPRDLDAHLTGPDGAGGRYHVYYGNTNEGGATLDHDDTDSYGPETITFTTPHDGVYRYSVHNYSDQSADGTAGMANNAVVRLYDSDGQIGYAHTPIQPGPGNTWRVLEVVVTNGVPSVNDGNEVAGLGQYFTASSSGDETVFLTGGEPAGSKPVTD